MKKISLVLAVAILLSTLISLFAALPSAAVEEWYPEGYIMPTFTWARTYYAKAGTAMEKTLSKMMKSYGEPTK